MFQPAAQPVGQQHLLDAARQLHRHPHRLPAARRAARLDRRRPDLLPLGRAQLRRAGLLHQVAGRSGRCAAGRRPVSDGRPAQSGRRRRRAGLGRRGRDLPLDDVRRIWRPAAAGKALSGDDPVHRVLREAEHARRFASRAVPLLRRLAQHRGRHADGRDPHRLLRPQHAARRPGGRSARQARRRGEVP